MVEGSHFFVQAGHFADGAKTDDTVEGLRPFAGTFFIGDADCAAHTEYTPWEYDRQFLDLVARSGTALFISVDPQTIQAEQKKAFRAAVQTALSGTAPGGCEPLDWLFSTTPRLWRFGREKTTYNWDESVGASPFRA